MHGMSVAVDTCLAMWLACTTASSRPAWWQSMMGINARAASLFILILGKCASIPMRCSCPCCLTAFHVDAAGKPSPFKVQASPLLLVTIAVIAVLFALRSLFVLLLVSPLCDLGPTVTVLRLPCNSTTLPACENLAHQPWEA